MEKEEKEKKSNFETAGKIMTFKVPSVKIGMTIDDVKKLLSKNSKDYDMVGYIYVLDKLGRLSGVMSIKNVFQFPNKTHVEEIMNRQVISVRSHTDQERATLIALQNDLKAIPVVDKENNFLGVLTPQTILDTLHKEGIEDILRQAGIRKFKDPAIEIISASTYTHSKKRFPWLLIGLFGGIIAALIVSFFENILDEYLLLAAFIPAVVYMADAVGAQAQTIFIRSMALDKNMQIGKYAYRELKINLILGSILGLIFYFVILIGWGMESSFFALILGTSIFATVLISMAVSLALPFSLQKMKFDPAITSGPIGTAIRDLTSLIVYFAIAHFLILNFF